MEANWPESTTITVRLPIKTKKALTELAERRRVKASKSLGTRVQFGPSQLVRQLIERELEEA